MMTTSRRDMTIKMTCLLMEIALKTGHELDQSLVQSRLDEVIMGDDQEEIDEFFDVVLKHLHSVACAVEDPDIVALLSTFDMDREKR